MHSHSIDDFRHSHHFLGASHERNERRTWAVIAVSALMMVGEIVGGWWYGSVALLADGLHMATHAGALLIAALAYAYSRRYAQDRRLAFSTGKVGDLGAFSSAIVLAFTAVLIGYESFGRLLSPVPIAFDQAIAIAVLGLAVNLVSALLLRDDHSHHGHGDRHGHAHEHEHGHSHSHGLHRDHNLRAAFVHVLSDAAVSVLVIAGLVLGRQLGWVWMDPIMGLIASVVILIWSWSLLRSSGAILLDAAPDRALSDTIVARLEQDGDRVSDFHLWRVGPGHLAAVISIVSDDPAPPSFYKQRLAGVAGLSHVTIEVERCPGAHSHG